MGISKSETHTYSPSRTAQTIDQTSNDEDNVCKPETYLN